MGKSATARFFAEAGVPVHDADAAVHRLYASEAVPAIEAAFPGSTAPADGATSSGSAVVDREKLGAYVLGDPAAMARLEGIVHPLVRREEVRFLDSAADAGAAVAVLEIPLLFETGADRRVDAVVVVTAPADVQRARAFERPGMTEEKFRAILARQLPDVEKRRRADFIVDTSQGFDSARAQVHAILLAVPMLPIRRAAMPDPHSLHGA